MFNYKARILIIPFLFVIWGHTSDAAVVKTWDVKLDKVFNYKVHGKLHPNFSPILVNDTLVLGTDRGVIKTVNVNTQEIKSIKTIPIIIEGAGLYGKDHIIFYGKRRRKGRRNIKQKKERYYYACVDITKKRLRGYLQHNGPLWKFDDWAVFERKKYFIVFNPKLGKIVYRQKANNKMTFPVFTTDDRNIFFNSNNQLVELGLPELGAGLAFSMPDKAKMIKERKKDLLKFSKIVQLEDGMLPDNLTKTTVYYHRKNGAIGQWDLTKEKLIWERTFFKQNMTILGPHEKDHILYYLVSYPKGNDNNQGLGKLIALDRKKGNAFWLSKDLKFSNFAPTEFRNSMVSGDTEGNLLFLDTITGSVKSKFDVGGALSKPIIRDKIIYIYAGDTLYRFDYKYPPNAIGERIRDFISWALGF